MANGGNPMAASRRGQVPGHHGNKKIDRENGDLMSPRIGDPPSGGREVEIKFRSEQKHIVINDIDVVPAFDLHLDVS